MQIPLEFLKCQILSMGSAVTHPVSRFNEKSHSLLYARSSNSPSFQREVKTAARKAVFDHTESPHCELAMSRPHTTYSLSVASTRSPQVNIELESVYNLVSLYFGTSGGVVLKTTIDTHNNNSVVVI